tara:strand:- start:1168 stop:1590 length:423 start_codon:yes stop_codon:yes gene_type:complete
MPLSTDQISQIHAALLSTIQYAISEVLENELYNLDSDIDSSDVSYDVLTTFNADIEELADNALDKVVETMCDELAQKTQLAISEYKASVLPSIKYAYERDGQVDGPARREAWANLIDSMNKNGVLSDLMAENIDADVEAL